MKRSWVLLWVMVAVATLLALWFLWWWQSNRQVTGGMCGAGDLTLSTGRIEGTAGTQYVHVIVTNKGNRTCALNGYPTVSLLDASGNRLGTSDAQQNNSVGTTAIVLPPHDQAYVGLGLPDANNFDAGVCSDTSHTLRLYLPGVITPATTALTTDMAQKVCPGYSVTAFQYGG